MDEKKFPFSRKFRIYKASDYKTVFQKGEKISTENLHIHILPNQLKYSRLGISVSKAVGNAVERNKRKRWIREAFRTSPSLRKRCLDIIIRLHNNCKEIDFRKIKEELESVFEEKPQKRNCL